MKGVGEINNYYFPLSPCPLVSLSSFLSPHAENYRFLLFHTGISSPKIVSELA